MRSIQKCPACNGQNFQPFLACVDHTVSHETFTLKSCEDCGLLITDPQPNKEDLDKYYLSAEYISHSDQTSSIVDIIYKLARVQTLRWKYSLIKHYSQHNQTILDYGCGTGYFLKECLDRKHSIIGVEPSPFARQLASQKTKTDIKQNLSQVRVQPDVITAWHVIEHVHDLLPTLANLADLLKPAGTIFIAVPNPDCYDADVYKEFWAGYDVPRHLWHFKKPNMINILQKNGLRINTIIPMKLDAYYVSLLSEKYKTGSLGFSNLLKAFRTGFKSNYLAARNLNHSSLIYIAEKK